jgi:nicotinamidase-related amidase
LKESFVLLVMDVQQGLFNREAGLYDENHFMANINKLIKYTRDTGNYLIFLQHNNDRSLIKYSPGWELHKGIDYRDSDIKVEKEDQDAFKNSQFKNELDKLNVNRVVITGLVSHKCIRATCKGAVENGFKATLVSDAHSNYEKDGQKVFREINEEMGKIVEVKSTMEIIKNGVE